MSRSLPLKNLKKAEQQKNTYKTLESFDYNLSNINYKNYISQKLGLGFLIKIFQFMNSFIQSNQEDDDNQNKKMKQMLWFRLRPLLRKLACLQFQFLEEQMKRYQQQLKYLPLSKSNVVSGKNFKGIFQKNVVGLIYQTLGQSQSQQFFSLDFMIQGTKRYYYIHQQVIDFLDIQVDLASEQILWYIQDALDVEKYLQCRRFKFIFDTKMDFMVKPSEQKQVKAKKQQKSAQNNKQQSEEQKRNNKIRQTIQQIKSIISRYQQPQLLTKFSSYFEQNLIFQNISRILKLIIASKIYNQSEYEKSIMRRPSNILQRQSTKFLHKCRPQTGTVLYYVVTGYVNKQKVQKMFNFLKIILSDIFIQMNAVLHIIGFNSMQELRRNYKEENKKQRQNKNKESGTE